MKNLVFIFLLMLLSCKQSDSEHQIISFEDSEEINFFDFDTLDDIESDIMFKNYNCKKGNFDTKYGKASFFLIDVNGNNIFTDHNDVLIIDDFNLNSPKSFPIDNTLDKRNLFAINKNVIKFDAIQESSGSYEVKFQFVDKPLSSVKKENRHIDKIPNLNFTTLDSDTLSFSDFEDNNKLIYIEFWTSWCSPCIQNIPTIKKIHLKFNDEVEIISLNADGDRVDPDKFKRVISKYEMNWVQGVTNKEIKEEMDFNVYPKGFLFNSSGILISSEFSPSQLLNFLNSK